MDIRNLFPNLDLQQSAYFCGPNPPMADPQLVPYTVQAPRPSALQPTPPIDYSPERAGLAGNSRRWGDAPVGVQTAVIEAILEESSDLTPDDQATLLAIARLESGFNPDAAAGTTTASGVFQIIKKTGLTLGLPFEDRFDAYKNIEAGVALFKENIALLDRRYPGLTGDQRAVMLYALHHDGPSLKYGGEAIAVSKLVPYLENYRRLVAEK